MKTVTLKDSVFSIGDEAFGFSFINGADQKTDGFTVKCYKGSEAEKYAFKHGLLVEYLSHNFVTGFKPGSTIDDYRKKFPRYNAEFKDKFGNMLTSGSLFTGMIIKLVDALGDTEGEVVINGDVDGNGKIDSTDYLTVKRHILKMSTLYSAYFEAADTDKNGSIDATDYILIKRHILGLTEL